MTIGEAIREFREMIPSATDESVLTEWLSEVEKTLVLEVLLTHENPPPEAAKFDGYVYGEVSPHRELLVPAPFSRLYTEYLAMKYYIAVCDIARYNTFASLFYNSYGNYADYRNRTERPISRARKFTFGGVKN